MTKLIARPASPSWRGRVAGALLIGALAGTAGVLLPAGPAWAAGPAVTVTPDRGGPGTPVTLTGSGFCARAGCAPVRVTISGRQLTAEQKPDSSGAFRVKTQAPGGLTPGEHEIVATQMLDDGNEISASASFVYSPSRGEEAEREAESRDAVTNLVNPSAPTAPARGESLESAAAALEASASAAARSAAASSTPPADTSAVANRSGRSSVPVVLLVAAGVAALVAGGLLWRRRKTLGGAS